MVFDLKKILDRIAHILEVDSGETPYQKDIAAVLSISPSSLANMKSRGNLPIKEIALFAAERKISINWVLFGQNPRLVDNSTEERYRINFLSNIAGSAGSGSINEGESEQEWLTLDVYSVEALGLHGRDLNYVEAIRVTGDSMEPQIRDGSIILIDRQKTDIQGGGVFAVNILGNILIKRVLLNTKGMVELISANTTYAVSYEYSEDVIIIGKVVGSLEKQ